MNIKYVFIIFIVFIFFNCRNGQREINEKKNRISWSGYDHIGNPSLVCLIQNTRDTVYCLKKKNFKSYTRTVIDESNIKDGENWSCHILRYMHRKGIDDYLRDSLYSVEEEILRKLFKDENAQRGQEKEFIAMTQEILFPKAYSFINSLDSNWVKCENTYLDLLHSLYEYSEEKELAFARGLDICSLSDLVATHKIINQNIDDNIYFSLSDCKYYETNVANKDVILTNKLYIELYFTYENNNLIPNLKCLNPIAFFDRIYM